MSYWTSDHIHTKDTRISYTKAMADNDEVSEFRPSFCPFENALKISIS